MWPLTNWLLAAALALLVANPAPASFVLRFVDPENAGVVAMDSRGGGHVLTDFRADADPIRRAAVPAVEASLDAGDGPERTFSFGIDRGGNGFVSARTATRAQRFGAPITMEILGTGGEVGPVELRVASRFTEEVPPDVFGFSPSIRINGASVPVPAGVSGLTSFFFQVGDRFEFDASLDRILAAPGSVSAPPATATLTTSLQVVPVAVPAPSAMAIATIGLGTLAGFGLARWRVTGRHIRPALHRPAPPRAAPGFGGNLAGESLGVARDVAGSGEAGGR